MELNDISYAWPRKPLALVLWKPKQTADDERDDFFIK